MSVSKPVIDIVEELRSLGACVSGCNGRCLRCPDEVANRAADLIVSLRAEIEYLNHEADRLHSKAVCFR